VIIQKEFNDVDRCNKCPIPQIGCWCNEFCENEANLPMRNGEKSMTMHQGGLWAIQRA